MSENAAAPLNPWVSIWRQPRATIQQIVDTDPEKHVVALAALTGVVQTMFDAVNRDAGDQMNLVAILALALIVGPIVGVVSLYLWAWLIRFTGRWIGGHGSTRNLRAAIAWAGVPMIAAGTLFMPELPLTGPELFTRGTPRLDQNTWPAVPFLVLSLVQMAAACWTLVAMCNTIGQVQGFSAWKALGNSALAGLVIVVPGIVLAIVIGVLAR
jgi:hypothetical protein